MALSLVSGSSAASATGFEVKKNKDVLLSSSSFSRLRRIEVALVRLLQLWREHGVAPRQAINAEPRCCGNADISVLAVC